MPPGHLECACGQLFLGVGDHEGGVQADHDGLAQVPVCDLRGGDRAVPGDDLGPHVPAGSGAGGGEPVAGAGVDAVQGPPQGGVGGHRAEQFTLVAQHGQVRHHPTTIGDHHGGVGQDPASVVDRDEVAAGQRRRHRRGQAGPVGQRAQRDRSGVRHDPAAGDFDAQIPGPPGKLVHLESAPLNWSG